MTEPVSGSSLLQAQDIHSHLRNHARSRQHRQHHRHSHERLHKRQDDASDDTIVQVLQTVSVVQIIDASGATVSAATQTSEPSTTTVGVNPDPTSALGDHVSEILPTALSSTASSIESPASSMPSSFPTVESFAPITSAPSGSSTTAFPTFAGVSKNSTITAPPSSTSTAASASSLSSNATKSLDPFLANLTTSTIISSSSSGTVLFNDTFTTTLFDSSSSSTTLASTTTTGTASSTGNADGSSTTAGGFGGVGGTQPAGSSPSSTEGASSSNSSSTSAGTVAGSVLGGLAGLALILVAALLLLRYKKQHGGKAVRLSDGNIIPGTRGLMLGGGGRGGEGGPSSSGPTGMGETSSRRSIPFAIPAALANLTGPKRSSQRTITSSEGTERGFQKVSGRKLPSVLHHGGDGYSDPTGPRDTIMSGESFYTDSGGFYGGTGTPRLAVGSPMRPESGIPVYHPGPARTPVTESGHFSPSGPFLDPFLDPPPPRDPLGRSHASQDGSSRSHGSGSRFTEEI